MMDKDHYLIDVIYGAPLWKLVSSIFDNYLLWNIQNLKFYWKYSI